MGRPDEGDGQASNDVMLYKTTTEHFRQAMLRKLYKHAHKGAWSTMSVAYLLERAKEELVEVHYAVAMRASSCVVENECADVANLLMMLADNYSKEERK